MSEENNKKAYDHYTGLIDGKLKTGNSVKDELIVSDAKRHLADLVKKNPSLVESVEEVKEEPEEEVTKSKGKK